MPVARLGRKSGMRQATCFDWKKKHDGLMPTEMRRLKQVEDENARLCKVVADLSLDKEMLQDVIRQNSGTSAAVPRERALLPAFHAEQRHALLESHLSPAARSSAALLGH